MPGISLVYSKSNFKVDEKPNYLLHEEFYFIDSLFKDNKLQIIYSGYEGYPLNYWENQSYFACVEGLIYNQDDKVINNFIELIINEENKSKREEQISQFVHHADGDYIFYIYNKVLKKLTIIGDLWGRLKAYHYHDDEKFIFSRENSFMLNHIPSIKFNKQGIAEFIIYEFNLDNKTMVEDIYKTSPSFQFDIYSEHILHVNNKCNHQFDFTTPKPPLSRKQTLQECSDIYKKTTKSRVDKLTEKKYNMTVDLSGGYDTRAVFFGVQALNDNIKYYTEDLLAGIESKTTIQLAKTCQKDVTLIHNDYSFDPNDMTDISYRTGGNVNPLIASYCYNSARNRRNQSLKRSVKFGGFGGEYIRHPYIKASGYRSIIEMLKDDIYVRGVGLKNTAKLLNMTTSKLYKNLSDHYDNFPEINLKDKIKHVYFDYYNNVVNMGEERARIHFWTIQPLLSKDLLHYFLNKIPGKYVGYKYFIEFLKHLNPVALDTPIFNSSINLKSKLSIQYHDFKYKFIKNIKQNFILKKTIGVLYRIFNYNRNPINTNTEIKESVKNIYDSSKTLKVLFNERVFKNTIEDGDNYYNIKPFLTTIFYIAEIENRHKDKIQY